MSSHVSADESFDEGYDDGESSDEGYEEGPNEGLSEDSFGPRQIIHGDLTDEFFDLALWAFGPDGIRSLDTVAFGDFAFGNRTPHHNFLLRRDAAAKGGFRFVELQGPEGRGIVSEHRRVLEACPLGGLEDLLSAEDAKRARDRLDAMRAGDRSGTPSPRGSEREAPPVSAASDGGTEGEGDVEMAD